MTEPPRQGRNEDQHATDYEDLLPGAGVSDSLDDGIPSDGDATNDLDEGYGRHFEVQQDLKDQAE